MRWDNLALSNVEKEAIHKLITDIQNRWKETKFKLFGSKVRGTSDEESDIDILILLPFEVTKEIRRDIIHKIFEINLEFDTNISGLIMSEKEWQSNVLSFLPIHEEVEKEGVEL
jgi:predicted nucleotidyltransferase